jgi:NADH-quinone oxidoreductase subunit L
MIENCDLVINLGNWIEIFNLKINWTFRFDNLTKAMLFPVILISLLVQIFSYSYMEEDPHKIRYYLYLNLFTYQML